MSEVIYTATAIRRPYCEVGADGSEREFDAILLDAEAQEYPAHWPEGAEVEVTVRLKERTERQ